MNDLHTARVGQAASRQQFYLAYHHVPDLEDGACKDYLALYRFSQSGTAIDSDIRRISDLDTEQEVTSSLLSQLGEYSHQDIVIAPFRFDYDGLIFGLIPDHQTETLTLEPGSMIMLMEPWDGEHYT